MRGSYQIISFYSTWKKAFSKPRIGRLPPTLMASNMRPVHRLISLYPQVWTSFIYDPYGWMLYNLGFLCFIWSKFTSTRHENKPIFPHDVMKFYIMNFIWKFQWKFIPTVLTPQIIYNQKYHSHLPRHIFLWS